MGSITLDSYVQEQIPIMAAMLSLVVVTTAASRTLKIATFWDVALCTRAWVEVRGMIQLASGHAEIENLDDGVTSASSNESFATDWKEGVYWGEGVHEVSEASDG
jgi:hypothetical protein